MRAWILVGLLGLAPATTRADELQRARELFDEMEYQTAQEAAGRVLEQAEAGPAELAEAYRLQGLSLSALEQMDEALAAFRAMLSIDPRASLPPDTSPKLAAPFFQAVAMAQGIQPISLALAGEGPRLAPGDSVRVLLKSDPMGLVRGVRLVSRLGAGAWTRGAAREIAGAGQAELALPPADPVAAREYYLEALTAAGGVLARLGDPAQPFMLAAAGPAADRVAADERPVDPDEGTADASPWFETWWFWTAVGVVVVGTAVGLGVGLGAGGSDQAVDYRITLPLEAR